VIAPVAADDERELLEAGEPEVVVAPELLPHAVRARAARPATRGSVLRMGAWPLGMSGESQVRLARAQ